MVIESSDFCSLLQYKSEPDAHSADERDTSAYVLQMSLPILTPEYKVHTFFPLFVLSSFQKLVSLFILIFICISFD